MVQIRRPGLSPFANIGNAAQRGPAVPQGDTPTNFPEVRQVDQAREFLFKNKLQQYSSIANNPAEMSVQTIPTRIQFINWFMVCPVAFTPVLVVPRNPARMGLVIANYFTPGSFGGNDKVYCSFGQPSVSPSGGSPAGFPITPDTTLPWPSGTVPVNDLWMWHNDGSPHLMFAMEGFEAPEAN